MPAEHMDLPAQAMACIISDLEPSDMSHGWNPTDGSLLAEIATNKVLHAVVKVSRRNSTHMCPVWVSGPMSGIIVE